MFIYPYGLPTDLSLEVLEVTGMVWLGDNMHLHTHTEYTPNFGALP